MTHLTIKKLIMSNETQISDQIIPAIKEKELELISLLPDHIDLKRFKISVINEVTKNPKLLECSKRSLQNAFISASYFGLEPNSVTGSSYIVPYNKEATLVVGYKGLIDLVTRAGVCDSVDAKVVYEKDLFIPKAGTNPSLEHELYVEKGEQDSRGDMIGVYAVAFLGPNKAPKFEYIPKSELLKIKRESRAGSNQYAPWNKHFEAMCKKTAIKRVIQTLPKNANVDSKSGITVDERINLASESSEGGEGYVHTLDKGFKYVNSESKQEQKNDSNTEESTATQADKKQETQIRRPVTQGRFNSNGRFKSFKKSA